MVVKQARLDYNYLSKNYPPLSRDEHHKTWLMNAGSARRSKNNMSQLPTPEFTTRSLSRALTTSSSKSSASVHDFDYRETLKDFNNYVPGKPPPPGIKQEAEKIVFRRRGTPELENGVIDQLKETIRDCQNKGEGDVRFSLRARIIPGYSTLSDKRFRVISGEPWSKAAPIPFKSSLLDPPLPLPKPKPDTTFAFSETAFTRFQLDAMRSLVQSPDGPSFASPSPGIPFPFAVVEYTSQAEDGSIRVATNQAAGAAAIALNGFLELIARGTGLDASAIDKPPLFFSVAMDQNVAYLNVHWIGRASDTNEHTFHLEELKILPLRYDDNIRVLQRALKNILDYAADHLLKLIVDALDKYRIKRTNGGKTEPMGRQQVETEVHVPPSPPKPPRSKRTRQAGLKAPKEATGPRKQRQQETQMPAEAQRSGVRTRRIAMLETPS